MVSTEDSELPPCPTHLPGHQPCRSQTGTWLQWSSPSSGVSPSVLQGGNVVAVALAESLEWAVGFFFGDLELSLELWTVIAGISGFDD